MPCQDGGPSWDQPYIDKINKATRVACELVSIVKRLGLLENTSEETQVWAVEHGKLDEKREAEAKAFRAKRAKDLAAQIKRLKKEHDQLIKE